MKYDEASLDRAILALPLEQPPVSLRASILASTIYRAAPLFSPAEITAVASITAVLVWLGLTTAPQIGLAVAAVFSNLTLLAWLAAGVATAFALEVLTLSQPLFALSRRAKERAKP